MFIASLFLFSTLVSLTLSDPNTDIVEHEKLTDHSQVLFDKCKSAFPHFYLPSSPSHQLPLYGSNYLTPSKINADPTSNDNVADSVEESYYLEPVSPNSIESVLPYGTPDDNLNDEERPIIVNTRNIETSRKTRRRNPVHKAKKTLLKLFHVRKGAKKTNNGAISFVPRPVPPVPSPDEYIYEQILK